MEYRDLLEEIIILENSDFSIEMLNDAKRLLDKAYNIYLGYKKYGINIDNKYVLVKKRIEATLYNKVKMVVPDTSKETLMRLIKSIGDGYINDITNVLILNRNIVLQGYNSIYKQDAFYLSSNEMISIDNCYGQVHHRLKKELKDNEINSYFNLIITSINNFVALIIDDQEKLPCLKFENNKVTYGAKNVELFIDASLEKILEMIKKNKVGVIKAILCHHGNQVCYLQIDIHKDYVVVKDIPNEVISLKNQESKEKQYTYQLIG